MKRLLILTSMAAIVLMAATAVFAAEITVTGKLQKTVEPGGWVIAGKEKYLLLNASKFQKESWFKVATTVEAVGETKDVMTTYMEGTPFEARTMRPVERTEAHSVTRDLTKIGAIIDAAGQSGANDMGGISFTLRKDRPAKDMALKEATREALSKAQVIAQALGGRVSRIVEVQEEGTHRPQPVYQAEAFMKRDAISTPVEVGSLDINSRVQLIAEIETSL